MSAIGLVEDTTPKGLHCSTLRDGSVMVGDYVIGPRDWERLVRLAPPACVSGAPKRKATAKSEEPAP